MDKNESGWSNLKTSHVCQLYKVWTQKKSNGFTENRMSLRKVYIHYIDNTTGEMIIEMWDEGHSFNLASI